MLLLASFQGSATSFTAVQSGNWNVASTWSASGSSIPAAGDVVTIGSYTVTIPAGYNAAAKNLAMNSGCTLTVASTGSLEVNGASGVAAMDMNGATLTNSGSVKLGNISATGTGGIIMRNGSGVANNAGAFIEIDNIGGAGITMSTSNSAMTFTNDGTIKIGANANVSGGGINLVAANTAAGTFANTGLLEINNTGGGIFFNGGTLDNTGTISIGNLAAVGGHGLALQKGTANNNAGGTINISNVNSTGSYAIWRQTVGLGFFTNAGNLNIGLSAAVIEGVFASITNTGTITFGNVTGNGVSTGSSTITNASGGIVQTAANGKLKIANQLVNQSGGTIINSATGLLTVNGTLANNSGATITNNGTLAGTGSVTQSGTLTNNSGSHIAPGGSAIGTLAINGDIDLGGATLDVQIDGSSNDVLTTAKATVSANTTLNATIINPPSTAGNIIVLNGSNLIGTISGTAPANFTIDHDYSNGNIRLIYTTIATGAVTGPLCAGSTVNVAYTKGVPIAPVTYLRRSSAMLLAALRPRRPSAPLRAPLQAASMP